MDIHATQPFAIGLQLLDELLLHQMKQLDVRLGHHHQARERGMKRQAFHFARRLGKGELALGLGDLMDGNGAARGQQRVKNTGEWEQTC